MLLDFNLAEDTKSGTPRPRRRSSAARCRTWPPSTWTPSRDRRRPGRRPQRPLRPGRASCSSCSPGGTRSRRRAGALDEVLAACVADRRSRRPTLRAAQPGRLARRRGGASAAAWSPTPAAATSRPATCARTSTASCQTGRCCTPRAVAEGAGRKWLRRHPQPDVVGRGPASWRRRWLLALAVAGAAGRERLVRLDAAEAFEVPAGGPRRAGLLLAERAPTPARLDEGMLRCRRLLARYRVLEDAAWRDAGAVAAPARGGAATAWPPTSAGCCSCGPASRCCGRPCGPAPTRPRRWRPPWTSTAAPRVYPPARGAARRLAPAGGAGPAAGPGRRGRRPAAPGRQRPARRRPRPDAAGGRTGRRGPARQGAAAVAGGGPRRTRATR